MSKNLVTNGFAELTFVDLVAKAKHINSSLLGEVAIFAEPNPSLATIKEAIDVLAVATADAETGDRIKVAIRDEAAAILIDLLQQGGTYVNNIANGNRLIALKSGYDIVKEKEPRVLLPITTAPVVKRTPTAGTLNAKIKSQLAASKGTTWYITDDPSKPMEQWMKLENQHASVTFVNLVPGKTYTICAELNGPRQQSQMSPWATAIA
jgi:hypothetical protein